MKIRSLGLNAVFFFSHGSFQKLSMCPFFFSIMAYHIPPFPNLGVWVSEFSSIGSQVALFIIISYYTLVAYDLYTYSSGFAFGLSSALASFCSDVFSIGVVLPASTCPDFTGIMRLSVIWFFSSVSILGVLSTPLTTTIWQVSSSAYLPAIPFGDCDWVSSVYDNGVLQICSRVEFASKFS